MAWIERMLDVVARLLAVMTSLAIVAMLAHVNADVLLKYLANSPVPSTAEITGQYYMVAIVFLPLALIELNNSAIHVELFYEMFSEKVKRVCLALAYAGQIAFFSFLAYQSALDAWTSYLKGEYIEGIHKVIIWPASFMIPFGFGLAVVVSLLRLVQTLLLPDWEARTKPRESPSQIYAAD